MQEIVETKTEQKTTSRPPIVVVMGHIDHGKSMILETIRKTKMLEKEAGGITQHIGAYQIETSDPAPEQARYGAGKEQETRKITFIDTPGHEIFSKMRSRGAKVADIAVLVVAADEGIKPQTKEAIDIIKNRNLPFIVALNKIDKPEANPEKVKQELAEAEVLVESYGGKVPSVEVSAKTGANLDKLLEMILLVAEMEGLSADAEKPAEGVVIETNLDPKRGITATLLVRDGTLRKGQYLAVGRGAQTLKIMEDFRGKPIAEAGPSSPVRLAGLSAAPAVGETFRAFSSKTEAENYTSSVDTEIRPPPFDRKETVRTSTPEIAAGTENEIPVFNIILKADVAGSREALEESLTRLQSETVRVKIIKSGVGDINESDLKLARAAKNVTVIGFKVKIDSGVRELAESSGVRILTGDIIYELLDEVKLRMTEMIPPEIKRTYLGKIKILKLFRKDGDKQILGGRVEDGIIRKGAKAEIFRFKEPQGSGLVKELQRDKTAVEEVGKGTECGMLIESKTAVQEGDVLEIYQEEMIKRTL